MREFIGTIPQRISRLPRDKRGFPVPFFVKWIDGEPHFPVMDPEKFVQAVHHHKCWICGGTLGGYKAFCIGPMCVINRVTAEPPSHVDCARFAVLNCPFMANPKVGRQLGGDEIIRQGAKVAGIMIERNPGVSAIWVTKSYKMERTDTGPLFRLGPATALSFWAHGREATREEVAHSVETGLPFLEKMATSEGAQAYGDYRRQVATGLDLINRSFEGSLA
jgi:hypothetical protein